MLCSPISVLSSRLYTRFLSENTICQSSKSIPSTEPNLDVWLRWKIFPPALPCSLCCFVSPVLVLSWQGPPLSWSSPKVPCFHPTHPVIIFTDFVYLRVLAGNSCLQLHLFGTSILKVVMGQINIRSFIHSLRCVKCKLMYLSYWSEHSDAWSSLEQGKKLQHFLLDRVARFTYWCVNRVRVSLSWLRLPTQIPVEYPFVAQSCNLCPGSHPTPLSQRVCSFPPLFWLNKAASTLRFGEWVVECSIFCSVRSCG